MAELLDICRFTAGSSGTGAFTDGTAEAGFLNLDDAGAENGKTYPYRAENATRTEWEIGYGIYDSSAGTLSRTPTKSSNSGAAVDFSTNPIVFITPFAQDLFGREVLTAARTYYVRHDGSDSNDGLANTSGGAFKTLQYAADFVHRNIDTAGFDVTINVQASVTPYAGFSVSGAFTGSGRVIFKTDAIKSSAIISDTIAVQATDYASFYLDGGFEVRGSLYGLNMTDFARIELLDNKFTFGDCTGGFMCRCTVQSRFRTVNDFYIKGSARNLFRASAGGYVETFLATGIFDSNATFADQVVYSSQASTVFLNDVTPFDVNGFAVTGKRFTVWENALIKVLGGTWESIPGTIDGEELSGGRYCISVTETDWATGQFFYDVSTPNGDTVITGLGFKPGFIDFFAAVPTGDDSGSIGWAHLKAGAFVNASISNAHALAAGTNRINYTQCIKYYQDAANSTSAVVSAVGGDGFTLTWAQNGSELASQTILVVWKAQRAR